MTEYERKALITKEQYNEIINLLQSKYTPEATLQINYYYDTPDFQLLKSNETLRIRKSSSGFTVQHKTKKYQNGSTRVCEEAEYPIDEIPESLQIESSSYNLLGALQTLRTNFYIDNFIISLDYSKYLRSEDYEIEIESDKSTDELPHLLEQFEMCFSEMAEGKYKRFIEVYKKEAIF